MMRDASIAEKSLITLEELSRAIGSSEMRYVFEETLDKDTLAEIANPECGSHVEALTFIPEFIAPGTTAPAEHFSLEIRSTLFGGTIMRASFSRAADRAPDGAPLYKVASTSLMMAEGSAYFSPRPILGHPFIQNFSKFIERQHKTTLKLGII
jgi:hypothetical protein